MVRCWTSYNWPFSLAFKATQKVRCKSSTYVLFTPDKALIQPKKKTNVEYWSLHAFKLCLGRGRWAGLPGANAGPEIFQNARQHSGGRLTNVF